MSILKLIKDQINKKLAGKDYVPRELLELVQYFRSNDPISFDVSQKDDCIVAVSNNFRFGSIVTSGKNAKELDENIKDAILTAFEVTSAYEQEAQIHNTGDAKTYAFA